VSSNLAPGSSTNDFWLIGDVLPGTGGLLDVTVKVDNGAPDGSVLATQVTLSTAGSQWATVGQLTNVETTPSLALAISSPQLTTSTAGIIQVSIDYSNAGSAPVSNVVVSFDPGGLSNIISTVPAFTNPNTRSWNIGTLAPGANGSIDLELITAASPGGIVSLGASAVGTGVMRAASLVLPAEGTGDMFVASAGWKMKPPGKKRNNGRVKLVGQLDVPVGFDAASGPVTITWSTKDQLLAAFVLPQGSLVFKGKGWKAKGVINNLPAGGDVGLNITKTASGEHKMKLTGSHLLLPFANSHDIRMSILVDGIGFSAERPFSARGLETPLNQQLRYRGDNKD
jgi:hypothetical protein